MGYRGEARSLIQTVPIISLLSNRHQRIFQKEPRQNDLNGGVEVSVSKRIVARPNTKIKLCVGALVGEVPTGRIFPLPDKFSQFFKRELPHPK
jgi:hypothetical protein